MSIILEALRKAEATRGPRQPVALTTVAAPRLPVQARVPRWGIAGAAVATLVSVVLAVLLLRVEERAPVAEAAVRREAPEPSVPAPQSPPPAANTAAPPPAATPPAAAPSTAEPAPEAGEVRVLALEARLAEPPATPPAPPTPGSVEVRDLVGGPAEGAPASAPARRTPGRVEVRDLLAEEGLAEPVDVAPPQGADADPGEAERQALENKERGLLARAPATPPKPATPSLDQLVADGQLNPPDISLDMHAWSEDPGARFVYINMRRYRVGETTREGAIVDDITPEGVILQLQGRRFLLSAH
jgi:general secretion pathway protein B